MTSLAPDSAVKPAWQVAALFVVMMAAQTVGGIVFGVPGPILPMLAKEFGEDGRTVAEMVIALPSLGMLLGAFISGWVVERLGLRWAIIGSAGAFGVLGSGVLAIDSAWLLLSTRFGLGVIGSFLTTACTMLLMQTYSGEQRSRFIGYQTGVGSAMSVIGILMAGAMAQTFGWRSPFIIYAIFAAIVVIVAVPSVPSGRSVEAADKSVKFNFLSIWPVYAAAALLFVPIIGLGAELPFLMKERGEPSPMVQSIVLGILTVMNTLMAFNFSKVQGNLGGAKAFALGLLFYGTGFLIIGFVPGTITTGIGTGLIGMGVGLFVPQLWVWTGELSAEAVRGRALGYLTSAMFFGGFCNPFVYGSLHKIFGLPGAFVAIGAALALGGVAVVALRPKTQAKR
jgi:MFS family permease